MQTLSAKPLLSGLIVSLYCGCLASSGGGGGSAPGDPTEGTYILPNPRISLSAKVVLANQGPVVASQATKITGTDVRLTFDFTGGLAPENLSPSPGEPGGFVQCVKLKSFKGYIGSEVLSCVLGNGTQVDEVLIWSRNYPTQYPPVVYSFRFSSSHFVNGSLPIYVEPTYAVYRDGPTSNPTFKSKLLDTTVYNKALVYATNDSPIYDQPEPIPPAPDNRNMVCLGSDTREEVNKAIQPRMSKLVAEQAKTWLVKPEVNHLILNSATEVRAFTKPIIGNLLSQATCLFTITHGVTTNDNVGQIIGLRPSYGAITFREWDQPMPTSSEIAAQDGEVIHFNTSEMLNFAFPTNRVAPPRFNLVFLFACGSGAINGQGRVRYSLKFSDQDSQAIDQAILVHNGTLQASVVKTDKNGNKYKVGLDGYVELLMSYLQQGFPLDRALNKIRNDPDYSWVKVVVLGDSYSRLARVYLSKDEYMEANTVVRNGWYYAKGFKVE